MGLSYLVNPRIKKLILEESGITDQNIELITSKLGKIEILEINKCTLLTNEGVSGFIQPTLQKLTLTFQKVDSETLVLLSKRAPQLSQFDLTDETLNLTPEDLNTLTQFPNLRDLSMNFYYDSFPLSITEESIQQLADRFVSSNSTLSINSPSVSSFTEKFDLHRQGESVNYIEESEEL